MSNQPSVLLVCTAYGLSLRNGPIQAEILLQGAVKTLLNQSIKNQSIKTLVHMVYISYFISKQYRFDFRIQNSEVDYRASYEYMKRGIRDDLGVLFYISS